VVRRKSHDRDGLLKLGTDKQAILKYHFEQNGFERNRREAVMPVSVVSKKRRSPIAISVAILTFVILPTCAPAESDCEVPAVAQGYRACFPKGWLFSLGEADRALACNGPAPCSGTGGGFPLKGRIIVAIVPATALKWDPTNSNLTDMMNEHVKGRYEARTVVQIPRESQGLAREIQLWQCPYPGGYPGMLTYGLRVQRRLFLVLVEFSDEMKNRERFRKEAADIVSSIRLTGTK
jgi:hypothetical protein